MQHQVIKRDLEKNKAKALKDVSKYSSEYKKGTALIRSFKCYKNNTKYINHLSADANMTSTHMTNKIMYF